MRGNEPNKKSRFLTRQMKVLRRKFCPAIEDNWTDIFNFAKGDEVDEECWQRLLVPSFQRRCTLVSIGTLFQIGRRGRGGPFWMSRNCDRPPCGDESGGSEGRKAGPFRPSLPLWMIMG